jgi:hypothetical protein
MDEQPPSSPPPPPPEPHPDGLDDLPERAAYKAQWMATRSPAERTAWLAELRRVMAEFPNADQFIRGAEELMRSTQVKMEADIRLAHSGEQLEATAATMLDNLMSGEQELPEHPHSRALLLLFLTATAHQYAYLRERFAQEDVQDFLGPHIAALLRAHREGAGDGGEGFDTGEPC